MACHKASDKILFGIIAFIPKFFVTGIDWLTDSNRQEIAGEPCIPLAAIDFEPFEATVVGTGIDADILEGEGFHANAIFAAQLI